METNVAYDSVQLVNNLQPEAEPFYELVDVRADKNQATPSVPEKVKTRKKSKYIFAIVVIAVTLVMALLALVLAMIAIISNKEVHSLQSKMKIEVQAIRNISNQEIQSLRSEVNFLKMEIQTLESETNISNQEIQSLQSEVNVLNMEIQTLNILKTLLTFPLGAFQNPASSCRDIPQGSPSGEYWIQTSSCNSSVQVYCDMDRSNCSCSTTGGWMRVANLDMTDPSQQCPVGFRLVRRTTAPLRTCGRPEQLVTCLSTTYQTYGVEYSHVCGQIQGYQYGAPNAFAPYSGNPGRTIDTQYVDGVSLTHGQSPRQHIWTFAAAFDEIRSDGFTCPCTQPEVNYTGIVPPFIGQDYFCETASRERYQLIFFPDDPLWDGQGCGGTSTCCDDNNTPWFCKQLPQTTTDDIELRLCFDEPSSSEDALLELVEIYVH